MRVQHFFDERTSTLSYVVSKPGDPRAVVIDPVLDFDSASGRCWTESAEAIVAYLERESLTLTHALDTHAHADHLSAIGWFREYHGARTVIGSAITLVQPTFRDLFNLGDAFPVDGSQFDCLLADDELLDVGPFQVRARHTPGHTPGCASYQVGDALFVGDLLFMPDYGTARCDFPGGDAGQLYDSVVELYRDLPAETRVFTCHDYRPDGRPLAWESRLGEQRRSNVQLSEETGRAAFVAFRKDRDATLSMPALILPSVQVNIRAGRLPEPESNGRRYFKIPIDAFGAGVPE